MYLRTCFQRYTVLAKARHGLFLTIVGEHLRGLAGALDAFCDDGSPRLSVVDFIPSSVDSVDRPCLILPPSPRTFDCVFQRRMSLIGHARGCTWTAFSLFKSISDHTPHGSMLADADGFVRTEAGRSTRWAGGNGQDRDVEGSRKGDTPPKMGVYAHEMVWGSLELKRTRRAHSQLRR